MIENPPTGECATVRELAIFLIFFGIYCLFVGVLTVIHTIWDRVFYGYERLEKSSSATYYYVFNFMLKLILPLGAFIALIIESTEAKELDDLNCWDLIAHNVTGANVIGYLFYVSLTIFYCVYSKWYIAKQ